MTNSICGSFLTDKRSLVAFTWTITTVLTLVAFCSALVYMGQVHTHYKRLEHYYEQQQWEYNQYRQQNQEDGQEGGSGDQNNNDSADREIEEFLALTQMYSSSMTFVALYTMAMAFGLSIYGSTAIVGFTSLRGVYIGPCFSNTGGSGRLKLGVFGGAIVIFANILLVCAVIFGEVRVEDWKNDREDRQEEERDQEREPYEVERIATILCVTCMFLSALYTIFAILLFLYFGSEESTALEDDPAGAGVHVPKLSNDPRRENFITMGEAT